MNVENLKEGQVVKNYKELCILLDEKQKTGNSKMAQYKELERHISYHKEGNKFIIDKIYDKPLNIKDGRKEVSESDPRRDGVNSIYRDDISELILNLLSQSKDGELFLSAGKLLGLLKMVNENYSHGRSNIPKLSELLGIDEDHIYLFYNNTQRKLKLNLETGLNYLRRKSKIMWETVTTVCEKKVIMELNELGNPRLNNSGKIVYETVNNHRPATKEECQLILKYEEEITKELGCNDLKDIFIKGLWNTFRSMVNKKVKYHGNIQYFYDSYKIIYNHDSILKELNYIKRNTIEIRLNNNIIDSLRNSAKSANEKAKNKIEEELLIKELAFDEYEFEQSLPQHIYLQGSDEYIDNNNMLIYSIISPHAGDMTKQLHEPLTLKDGDVDNDNILI